MRRWCQTQPVLFMAGYLVFYLAFFALLEHRVTQPAGCCTAAWTT